jgi:SAM-dependent methyltransferase
VTNEDPYTIEWSEHAHHLAHAAHGDAAWYGALAQALVEPGDRVAVDFGSGGGGMTLALASALAEGQREAQVVAVDVEPTLLDLIDKTPAPGVRVQTVVADLGDGVEPVRAALAGPADVVWAAASVHHLGDQQAAVSALAGLLGPGGRLALAEDGLPARHLPWDVGVGEPGLETRLDAAQGRWFAQMRASLPGSVRMPYGWTEALRRAGLTDVRTRTALLESGPPLGKEELDRVLDSLSHRVEWLRPAGLLDEADLATWDTLLDQDSPSWLGRRTDLFRLIARSVHIGVRR